MTHSKVQPNVDVRAGTAYELPIEDASADAIVCAQVQLPIALINPSRFTGFRMRML